MLLLFKGAHRAPAQVMIGIALLALGLVGHAAVALLFGAVLVVWGLTTAIGTRRSGRRA